MAKFDKYDKIEIEKVILDHQYIQLKITYKTIVIHSSWKPLLFKCNPISEK